MGKTINQALKDLFLGLGGDASALADNKDISDYIDDLESAIEGKTESLIDDTEAKSTTTYSSSKIESLIPADELPEVDSGDNGKILAVVDGAWAPVTITAVADITTGAVTITLTPDEA